MFTISRSSQGRLLNQLHFWMAHWLYWWSSCITVWAHAGQSELVCRCIIVYADKFISKVYFLSQSRTPLKTGLIVGWHFLWTCLCRSLHTFYLLCCCFSRSFDSNFRYFNLQNAEGRKTVSRRRLLRIMECVVILHCTHLALVSNGSRWLQNVQQDTRCEGSGRFQSIKYTRNTTRKKKRRRHKKKKASGQMCVLHRLSLWDAAGKILDKWQYLVGCFKALRPFSFMWQLCIPLPRSQE